MSDKRVAGYGRVSTQAQAMEGTSSEEQRRVIEEECAKTSWNLVQFFTDDGFSGKNDNRPGLKRLISDAKQGKFDAVMFTKLDRLGRNLRDILNIWHDLSEEGLEIICVQQPEVNTSGALGKAVLSFLGIFAEWERSIIRERTDSGRKSKWHNNEAIIGSLPYGYKFAEEKERKPGKIIAIDENEKAVYERVVAMYLSGRLSVIDIATRLNTDSLPSPGHGKGWSGPTVSGILKNRAYTGETTYNKTKCELRPTKFTGKQYCRHTKVQKDRKEWITVQFPPLITTDRFNEIQALMASRKVMPKRTFNDLKDPNNAHFLLDKNLLYCGQCGSRMVRIHRPNGGYYYQCYWNTATRKVRHLYHRAKCSFKTDADYIDNDVLLDVIEFLSNPGGFAKEWLKDLNIEEIKARCDKLRAANETEKWTLSKLYERLGTVDKDNAEILETKIKEHETKHSEIASELRKAEADYDLVQHKHDRLAEFERICAKGNYPTKGYAPTDQAEFEYTRRIREHMHSLPFEEKKRLVEAVISPETGGRVTARYFIPMLDGDCVRGLSKEEENELWKPLESEPPIVEIEFNADINKIENAISGLNRGGLLDRFGGSSEGGNGFGRSNGGVVLSRVDPDQHGTSFTMPKGNSAAITSSSHVHASRGLIFQLVGQGDRISTMENPVLLNWCSKDFAMAFFALRIAAGLLTATLSR
jgi:site-specific DNA recombinase